MNYKKRIVDELLKKKLKTTGAVLIEGPKWCGKTTTSKQIAKSFISMADPDNKTQNLNMANIKPSLLLKGDTPRLIDEWQLAPSLWDSVRNEVDIRSKEGQFILAGSSTPIDKTQLTHSGAGRFSWLLMRPMTLFESLESTGDVSLNKLFNNEDEIEGYTNIDIEELAYLVCRGGWPRSTYLDKESALEVSYSYYDAIVNEDMNSIDNVMRSSERIKSLLRSYARNQGTQVSVESIRKDMINLVESSLDLDTIYSYLNVLRKMFVIEDMPAWNPNLRSKSAIRTSNTRYFVDPSIAVSALGIRPNDLINDLNTFGLLFETMCVRDLRVYASALNGEVYHYRDSSGLECDAVIHLRNGNYGLIEIKLGGDKLIDEGANNLKKLTNKLDSTKMKQSSFAMVIIGKGNYAYKRDDGIYVVPITTLSL